MATNYVTLILDAVDGSGTPVGPGAAFLVPSAQLTDTTDNLLVVQAPVQAQFLPGLSPQVKLLATDDSTLSPPGWAWTVSFPGVPGSPASFSFFLPASPFSFTATNASPCVFTASGSAYANGAAVALSGSSLPGGFKAGATYYVAAASGTSFELASVPGGPGIASSSSGSGIVATSAVYLSSLAPVSSAVAQQGYMPLPSGTAASGYVPVATGAGQSSAWQSIAGAAGVIPTSAEGAAGGVATLDGSALVPAAQMRPFNYRGPVAASTTYNPWDVIVYKGNRLLITSSFTTGTGNPPFVSGSHYVTMGPLDEWHASDYGVVGDGTTDNHTALNNLISEVSAAGGGTIVLPPGPIMTSQTIVMQPLVHLRGMGWFNSAIRLLPNSNCDVIQFHKSTNGTTDPNAFFCGLWNLEIHGNAANQTPGTFNYGVNNTTNPLSTAASGDPDFDPTHILVNVWIKLTTGDGYFHNGRSGVRLIGVWTEATGGNGFTASTDGEFTDCHAESAALAGFYLPHSSVRLTGCKSFNNGTAPVWTTGQNWAAGQGVIYSGSLYIAVNVLTNDTVVPSSDPSNWTLITAATPQAYGHGYYVDGTNAGHEIALSGCDAQQNGQSGFYLKSCTGVSITGTSDQINTGLGTGTNQGTNPNNNATLVLDGATGNVVQLTSQSVGPAGYVMRVVNGATRNDVRMAGDTTAAAILSPDSLTLIGSGNSVSWNGVTLTGTLKSLADVSMTTPGNGTVPTWNSGAQAWQAVSPPSGNYDGAFGDGSDGSATLDGTATVAWATKVGSLYTMTRDCWLTGLTVNSGVTLLPNGNRIFCQGTVTIASGGSLLANGNPGSGSTAGAATGSAVLGGGVAGGAGQAGNGTSGSNGSNATLGVGSSGAGGAGASGLAGGAASAENGAAWMLRAPQILATGTISYLSSVRSLGGGCGGGGGGGDSTNKGGGGGSGAGIIAILAWSVTNAGTMSATGGGGGAPSAGNCGGGGSGGGGLILMYTLSAWTNTGTTAVTAGAAGSGVGTGANGTAGTAGNVLNVVVQ